MRTRGTGISAMLMALVAAFAISACSPHAADYRKRASMGETAFAVETDDIAAEIQFGREVAARMLADYPLMKDDELTRYVSLVAQALAINAGRPEIQFRVAILKSDEMNAYAAPGGYIFITRGAIKQMQNEAELAAVIAHEMGHITGKHIVNELNIHASDDSPVSGFTRFLGGAGDPAKLAFLNMVDKAMDILLVRGYKKEDERDADRRAVMISALSAYEPAALATYLGRLKEARGPEMESLNRTHPPFQERMDLIKAAITDNSLQREGYLMGVVRFNVYKKRLT